MNSFWILVKDTAVQMASVAVIAIFVQNIIFTRALGTTASLFIIRKRYSIWQFGLILTVITTPVSYTHLDVYKRQGPGRLRGCRLPV